MEEIGFLYLSVFVYIRMELIKYLFRIRVIKIWFYDCLFYLFIFLMFSLKVNFMVFVWVCNI